ncbi:amidohydrolase family protein [Acidiphilium sp. PA]|uniref:amidohydrolase family protein n=1 Tax=Acidiphilium sp. PA TaxID=2871705 RepID=UPI0022439F22|nr:amidohydrolase family protein [Acidiphilium sp. PA]MCW8307721.1 amidohydrolase family protein [Acidiphilium sp. PA]
MIVDSHLHVWQVGRGDYDWLTPDLPIFRDFTIADARAAATGVDRVVLVQAAPTEAETAYLLDIAQHAGAFVHGVVGWTDLAAPDAARRIEALARAPALVGLRPMLQDMADTGWILRPEVARGLDAMAACGLVLDLLIRPAHLPHCLTLARRHPGLAMVIDHAAKPDIATGALTAWSEGLRRIAGETDISCKLSGLITEAGPAASFAAVAPVARRVLAWFGAARVMWGSDWPVLRLAADYQPWLAAAQALVRAVMPAAVEPVFATNALRCYAR